MVSYDVKLLSNIIFKPAVVIAPAQYARFLYQHNLLKHYDYPKNKHIEKQNIELHSRYDYVLKGTWYKHQKKNDKIIFLVPGYATVQLEMEYLAPFFINLGYDVVTFNTYAYGNSNALVTFGKRESEDFVELYEAIMNKGNYRHSGLFGHSMGANTVLHAGSVIKPAPDFIIAAAPFNRLVETIESHLSLWVPRIWGEKDLTLLSRNIIKQAEMNWGKNLLPLEAMTSVSKLSMPVLYLHGTADEMNPFYMSEQLSNVTSDAMVFPLVDAGHLDTFIKTKTEAEQAVYNFLSRFNAEKIII